MASNQLSKVIHHLRRALGAPEDADLSDGQLLQRFVAEQDETAFALLLDRYGPMVLGVCRRAVGNSHDAEDAFQATFLVLVRKAVRSRKRTGSATGCTGLPAELPVRCEMQAARRGPQAPEVPDMATTEPEPDDWHQVRPLLDQEIQRLPRKYRVPLVLCYLEGKTNEAAARQLRWPAGTVKTRLAKGRDLLRDRLARRGLSLSATAIVAALAPEAVSAAVPPLLASATLKTASVYVAGPTAGAVSASVLGLAEGTVRELFRSKLQAVAVVFLACVSLATGAGWAAYHALAREQPTIREETADGEQPILDDGGLAATVEQQVRDWQPTPAEHRLDEIGWAPNLPSALRLAREHKRPIFLLAHGGDLATARCAAERIRCARRHPVQRPRDRPAESPICLRPCQ